MTGLPQTAIKSAGETHAEAVARRRTPRRAYPRPVGVLVLGKYAVFSGRSLSEGGLGLTMKATVETMPVLDLIKAQGHVVVSLILPSGAVLMLRAEVVHHGAEKNIEHSIGIKFETISLHQRREIRYYVSAKKVGESDVA